MRSVLPMIMMLASTSLQGADAAPQSPYPHVHIQTTAGSFELELDRPRAPVSVANFLQYVKEDAYDGSIFHRVIPGFMAQGGGLDVDFTELPIHGVVPNESGNGLKNERGTIAMARTADPHSATRQFYINLVDNAALDPRSSGWGYAVFGRVVEGMETLDKIAAIPTGPGGPFPRDVPQSPVIIQKMTLVGEAEGG